MISSITRKRNTATVDPKLQFPLQPLEDGFKRESIHSDLHVKRSIFRAEINVFIAWNKNDCDDVLELQSH